MSHEHNVEKGLPDLSEAARKHRAARGWPEPSDRLRLPALDEAVRREGVHDHPAYRPSCNERVIDGQLRGACLNDDGSSVTPPGTGDSDG